MNKLKLISLVAAVAVFGPALRAQVILTPTTLSAAATTANRSILVATATPNASTADNFPVGGAVVIDNSLGFVTAVSGTTISVNWGSSSGTQNRPHASGALVWTARANYLPTKITDPSGSCTRTQEQVLPVVNALTGNATDCLGGRWVTGSRIQWPAFRVESNPSGGTAYTSLNTNGTAVGATTLYCSELNLRASKLLTGISILNGTTVTGNLRYAVLYDAAGNALANSALAGQASGTASIYEDYAFVNTASTPATGKYYATGPARYFTCLQDNAGGTTTVRMAVTGTGDNILTKGQTGATFGTVPALTVPTTFTTAVGPYTAVY